MGILNAIFAPFIVLYLVMYSFFRYFEVGDRHACLFLCSSQNNIVACLGISQESFKYEWSTVYAIRAVEVPRV
jgi:hypothetical protein